MRFVVASLFCIFCACAPPTYEVQQDFVPVKELTAVQYAEEGLQYMSRARYYEASVLFSRAHELYPDVQAIKMNLAIALRELGSLEESERILKELLEEGGYTAPVNQALAILYFERGEFVAANREYQLAIDQEIARDEIEKAYRTAMGAANKNDEVGLEYDALCFAFLGLGLIDAIEARVKIARIYLAMGASKEALAFSKAAAQGPKRQLVELKLIQAIARIGSKENENVLKTLGRLELAVRKRPELLPEIQTLRAALNVLMQEGEGEEKLLALDEEAQAEFHKGYSGKANESTQSRYWPAQVRKILTLQVPPEED